MTPSRRLLSLTGAVVVALAAAACTAPVPQPPITTTTTTTTTTTLVPSTVDQANVNPYDRTGNLYPACYDGSWAPEPNGPWRRGQVFTAGRSGTMDTVGLALRGEGAAVPARIEITTVSGGLPTATVLSTTDFTVAADAAGMVDVALTAPVAVVAGTQYAVLLSSRAASCTGTYTFTVDGTLGTGYGPGASLFSLGGNPWASYDADLIFRTWVR